MHAAASALLVLVLGAGCNLSRALPAGSALPVASQPAVSPSLPALTGFAVRIDSPVTGTQLPAGSPLAVAFEAVGGPFIEFDLLVDGALVASQQPSTSAASVRGSLSWAAPSAGEHTLTVRMLDQAKDMAQADITVAVTGSDGNVTQPTGAAATAGGFQIRFTNLTDGGTIAATLDSQGKPQVKVDFEVSGLAASIVTMTANGLDVVDQANNPKLNVPFDGEIAWSPLNGAGTYTLVALAMTQDKQYAKVSASVTVTGVPTFTATPPPPSADQARQRFSQLYQQLYGLTIPDPSMQRADFPKSPQASRWISSIYYKGFHYYIDLYDDTHDVAQNPQPYSDPQHRVNNSSFILCRPAGQYKILVVFVDYGNLPVDKADSLAQVPIFANWTNQLYNDFARSQGFAVSPLSISAEGAWMTTPFTQGGLLTRAQVQAGTGIDPSRYDFIIQIDLDKDNHTGKNIFNGLIEQGGGLALQGCGTGEKFGDANIWSVVTQEAATKEFVHGSIGMDFNHELSHLFGMLDIWAYSPASIVTPDGNTVDQWIPSILFGWTDTDGDGLPEILDPTPYGSTGPQP